MEVTPTATGQIRVLMIQNQLLVRAGLRLLLERLAGVTVISEVNHEHEAVASAVAQQPDVILLDPDLADDHGLDLIPHLTNAAPSAAILVLTGNTDNELHLLAVRLGAKGVVLKTHSPQMLVKAIQKTYEGEIWLDRSTMSRLLNELAQPVNGRGYNQPQAEGASLTDRERDVIRLICEGLQNEMIGQRLAISEPTVRHHLTSIFDKLGVRNRQQLVIYAFRHGLVPQQRRR